jgi:hypothetical protein
LRLHHRCIKERKSLSKYQQEWECTFHLSEIETNHFIVSCAGFLLWFVVPRGTMMH